MRATLSCSSLCIAIAVAALAAAGTALRGQTLQLADGKVLLAKVEGEPTGDGLRVHRLDNGGSLDLRWDQLSPECALRIKQSFALAAEDQDELTVKVQEVRYNLNGTSQTVRGRIVDDGGGGPFLVVQEKGVTYKIPRAELLQLRQVEVPVTQVFTKDEFYTARLAEIAPGDSADKHMLLAEDLIKVRDYAHAFDQLQMAKDAKEKSRDPKKLDAMLERLQRYQGAQKERELLDQIQVTRVRGAAADFDNGGKLIAQFEKDFPQSKLKSEFDAEKKRFADARAKFFGQQVADAWRRTIQFVAEKKLLEPGVTWQAAKEYAEKKMGDDIAQSVATRFKLTLDETKERFAERAKYPLVGKRTELFSYGIGSWMLGETAIVKDTKQGEEKDKEKAPKDTAQEREMERYRRLLQKAMEQRKAAAQGGQGPGKVQEQTEEEWWSDASSKERAGWLRAYYAETSGQLVVTIAFTQPCITCYGIGTVSEMGQGGKVEKAKCYLCHGTKWLRSFKAY